eukprot:Ihof_evm6s192 gene=Ihof_evmTU6s192
MCYQLLLQYETVNTQLATTQQNLQHECAERLAAEHATTLATKLATQQIETLPTKYVAQQTATQAIEW